MTTIAKDIMNRDVITVRQEDSVQDVIELFSRNQIHGAPVVDENGTLIGVVSVTDILNNARAQAIYVSDYFTEARLNYVLGAQGMHIEDIEGLGEGCVHDFMNSDVVIAYPQTTVEDLAATMRKEKIHRIIITDKESKKVRGIVSAFDLLKLVSPGGTAKTAKTVGRA